ncbi:Uncharacterized membrane protein [Microbulbifer donghaiensis]|uniref:Uncharacterized membrane protein n=1 Tax=Microbulbifer donghaiensis TaxID=494016 RepID=A0A1M5IA60_9GAMM|nr:DUF2269 domain-containing protein [Microbulbifer donghaiensis]SHG25288.1 Uncharacterized membrane protein [Microbulbifer donghaiensis]
MNLYLTLKTLHVLSAMVVLGTGIGIAWYTLRAWLSGDLQVFRWISGETVAADWIFTSSAIVALLGSAAGMLAINPAWLQQLWLQLAIMLTGAVFLLWLPVVILQYRLRHHAREASTDAIQRTMRLWCLLGAAAFPLMVLIVFLMVTKPAAL